MTTPTSPDSAYQAAVQTIVKSLADKRIDDAVTACKSLIKSHPESNDALLLLGKARQQQGRFRDMLQLVETAFQRTPDNINVKLQYAGACQFCGHHNIALRELATIEALAQNDAVLLQHVAEHYVRSTANEAAHRCYSRSVALDPSNPHFLSNLAASFIAIGDLDKAEKTYSKVIGLAPNNYDAWHNRSTLRKQTKTDNHIGKLERTLKKLPANDPGETPLCYALAKELEDIGGEDAKCFSYLKRGADAVRRRIGYDVQLDVDVMDRISKLFDSHFAKNVAAAPSRRGPVFVLGLPRSGTTLVDRILSSHSKIMSKGEITDFALTMTRLGRSTDRQALLESSINMNFDELGQDYTRSVASYGVDAPYVIDKTPTNFLYIGLIAKALPGALIIHVKRHPADSCLAMYRTLFRMGYPFSYDLNDLATYFIGYDKLMRHWHETFPDRIHDVAYETLVDDQESVSRAMVAHCGLEWEAACLDFDKNTAPVTTASAAQVRRPIYRDALARWRRFENELEPLITQLADAGIEI